MKRTSISRRPSKLKEEFDAIYHDILPSIIDRGCEFQVYIDEPNGYQVVCDGPLVGHHAKGRNLRKPHESNDPRNLRCLCRKHHDFVHAHSAWARTVGLMITRTS